MFEPRSANSIHEKLSYGGIVKLNLPIPLDSSAPDQLDFLIKHLAGMEEKNQLQILGLSGIIFNTPSQRIITPDEICVTDNSRLRYVVTEGSTDLEPGDFVLSPDLGNCQAVFLEDTGGRLHFLHNFARGHSDIPPVFALNVADTAKSHHRATVNGVFVIARDIEQAKDIATDVSTVLKLPVKYLIF